MNRRRGLLEITPARGYIIKFGNRLMSSRRHREPGGRIKYVGHVIGGLNIWNGERVQTMNVSAFEDLLMAAVDHPDKATCCELTKMLEADGATISADISGKLELLWEGWDGALNEVQAAFCVFAASRGVADTPVFRKVFSGAVKRLLPPYLSGAPVMRALGVRDDKRPPIEVSARLNRLMNIKIGTIIFLPRS